MDRTRKRSKKREAILNCLRQSKRHPSAEWIYCQLKPRYPDLSRATVYRNLHLFLEEGEAASVGVVDGLERFDGEAAPHAHFICSGCGAVTDLETLVLPASLLEQAASAGRVDRCALSFTGLCRTCMGKSRSE